MSSRLMFVTFILIIFVSGSAQTLAKDSPSHMDSEIASNQDAALGEPEQARNKKSVISQIMAESGMDKMIEQLPAMVAMGFDQQPPPPINQDKFKRFRKNLIQVFDAEKMRQIITNYLDDQYEAQQYSKLLTLFKSPLAQKMTALEAEVQTPEAQQEMMQMGNIIMGQASPSRLEIVRKLDEATKSAELMADLQVMIAGTMMRNMNKIVPPAQRMTEEQLGTTLEQIRAQTLFPARQFIHLSMVYTYRSIDDAELNEYVELQQSDIGRWSTELMKGTFLNMFEEITIDLAALMEKNFVEQNSL